MVKKQNVPKDKSIMLFGRMIIIVAVLQLSVGIFYLLSAFIATKTGNIPLGFFDNLGYMYNFSYAYLIYGILDLIGGIGVLNLSSVARYLLIVMAGIKTFVVFVNSLNGAYFGGYNVDVYSIISLLYLLFVIFFLINKRKYFSKLPLES